MVAGRICATLAPRRGGPFRPRFGHHRSRRDHRLGKVVPPLGSLHGNRSESVAAHWRRGIFLVVSLQEEEGERNVWGLLDESVSWRLW